MSYERYGIDLKIIIDQEKYSNIVFMGLNETKNKGGGLNQTYDKNPYNYRK